MLQEGGEGALFRYICAGRNNRERANFNNISYSTVKNFDWVYDNFIGEGTRRNVYHRKEAEPSGIAAAGMPPASTSSRLFSSQSMKAWSVQLGSSLKEVSPPSSTDCDQMDNFLFGVS
jgi:hypothetical protein